MSPHADVRLMPVAVPEAAKADACRRAFEAALPETAAPPVPVAKPPTFHDSPSPPLPCGLCGVPLNRVSDPDIQHWIHPGSTPSCFLALVRVFPSDLMTWNTIRRTPLPAAEPLPWDREALGRAVADAAIAEVERQITSFRHTSEPEAS